jgi:hypothetical protein
MNSGARLSFPHNGVMNTGTTATVEYWARVTASAAQGFISWDRYLGSAEHKQLTVQADGSVAYVYAGSPWGAPATAPNLFPRDGEWHHVAFVRRSSGAWAVYVDGARVLAMGPGTGLGSNCWLTCNIINANTSTTVTSGGDGWDIDELRVSNVERYSSASFIPSVRHIEDANTVMLLHFDESTGSIVVDSGIASQQGQLTGNYTRSTDVASCPVPVAYCTAGTTTSGCMPAMSASGTPSSSAGSGFQLTCSNTEGGRYGLILYGLAPAAVSWAINSTSLVCVAPPQRRTGASISGGTLGACDGAYGLDFNAFIASTPGALGSPFTPGQVFYAQAWFRDMGAPKGTNLSNAIRFTLCE